MPPVPKPPTASKRRNRNLAIAIAVAGLVAVALIAGSILFTRGDSNDAATTTAPTETATDTTDAALSLVAGIPQKGTVLGNPDATVRMLQFEDLQCPICKAYTDDAFPAIVDEYVKPGRVKIDFRGLAFLGPDSDKALRIALASGFQNKLWEVVGLFYENQGEENSGWVTDELIDEILAQVPGLDAAKVKVDAKSAAVTKEIAAVQAEATALRVQGTPSFFLGDRPQPAVPDPAAGPTRRASSAPLSTTPSTDEPDADRPPRTVPGDRGRGTRPVSDRFLRVALLLVSAAGIGVAAYLTYVHYQPAALICTSSGGCETVQESKYAVLAGIPVAVLGLAAWIAALVLTIWNSELARTLTAALALAGLAFAAYLVILQLFVIDAICVWCMANDVVLAPLFAVLALLRLRTAAESASAPG